MNSFKKQNILENNRQAWRQTAPAILVGKYLFLDEITGEAALRDGKEIEFFDIKEQAAVIAEKVLEVLKQAGGSPNCLSELTLYISRDVAREDAIAAGLVLARFLGSIVHEATWIRFNFLRDNNVKLALRGTAVLPGKKPAKSNSKRKFSITESGRLKLAA